MALGLIAVLTTFTVIHTRLLKQLSASMQPGLYWFTPGASVSRGAIAVACIPAAYGGWAVSMNLLSRDSRCGGVEPVLKRVVAVAGDRVRVNSRGVWVNDVLQAGTGRDKALAFDCPPALPLKRCAVAIPHTPDGTRTLRSGEVMLLGDNRPDSFDGRYFGPVSSVLGAAAIIVPL